MKNKSFISRVNNDRGKQFEKMIEGACEQYKREKRAVVIKVPEPFKTTSTERNGIFKGRFLSNAEPDFLGTLAGGTAICFEAKYTSTDRIKQTVITDKQHKTLEESYNLGAIVGVCVGIGSTFSFIPWSVWREMKTIYGRKYMTREDIEEYEVRFNGLILFLDYKKEKRENAKKLNGKRKDGGAEDEKGNGNAKG